MMVSSKPLFLISNDDGYLAPGIRALVSMVKDLGEIVVCCPEGPRSGYSCAFSSAVPFSIRKVREEDNLSVWACTGTPVDCVKIAFEKLLGGRRPAIVLGGINHGDNSTVNNIYSGTMGIVREGTLKGVPSVAFSSCHHNLDADLSPLRPYVRTVVGKVLEKGLPKGVCLNVNFPKAQEFKGLKIARMARGNWIKEVVAYTHPSGKEYYWLTGKLFNEEPNDEATDQWALNNGYVAVTPTTLDITAYEMMEELKSWDLTV